MKIPECQAMKWQMKCWPVFVFCIMLSANIESRPLLEHLNSGSFEEQIHAMYYFGYSKNKSCFWILVKNLNKTFDKEDSSPWGERFRQAAAESLGRLGDGRAVPFLIKQYNDEKKESVKRSIIFSLGFFKDKEILPVLTDGLQSKNRDVLFESLETAASYGDTSVVSRVKSIAGTKDDTGLSVLSSYALIRLGDESEKHASLLRKELVNSDPSIRYWSAYCLSRTDRVEAIDDLIKALEIENYPWVRKEMEFALVMLAKKKREVEDR